MISIRRVIGGVILGLPFGAIFVSSWVQLGGPFTVLMFCGMYALFALMVLGVELAQSD